MFNGALEVCKGPSEAALKLAIIPLAERSLAREWKYRGWSVGEGLWNGHQTCLLPEGMVNPGHVWPWSSHFPPWLVPSILANDENRRCDDHKNRFTPVPQGKLRHCCHQRRTQSQTLRTLSLSLLIFKVSDYHWTVLVIIRCFKIGAQKPWHSTDRWRAVSQDLKRLLTGNDLTGSNRRELSVTLDGNMERTRGLIECK